MRLRKIKLLLFLQQLALKRWKKNTIIGLCLPCPTISSFFQCNFFSPLLTNLMFIANNTHNKRQKFLSKVPHTFHNISENFSKFRASLWFWLGYRRLFSYLPFSFPTHSTFITVVLSVKKQRSVDNITSYDSKDIFRIHGSQHTKPVESL